MNRMAKVLAAALAGFCLNVFGQGFPAKPVHAIISFTPGSSTDIVGRIVMQKVSEYWGQTVVAENRAGAGGSIGSAVVVRAAPDGYTLLINSSAHAVNPAIFAKLPYETTRDFIDIVPLAVQPNVLVVAGSSPIRSLADPTVREKLANLGNDPMDMSPEEFARFVRAEIADYARVVKTAGIKPQ